MENVLVYVIVGAAVVLWILSMVRSLGRVVGSRESRCKGCDGGGCDGCESESTKK